MCFQVQQYGVTFTLDRAYPCGQFANGDYWVTPVEGSLGKVKVLSITPAYEEGRNGLEVNPSRVDRHGFDAGADGFDETLVQTLPYSAEPNESLVKAVSIIGHDKTYLDTAVVLTVLAAAPPEGGRNVFRPPYFGQSKPLYSTNGMRLDLLPTLPALPDMPTLPELSERFARVQLDHQLWWSADQIHPVKNMPDYGAAIAMDNSVASLRLMVEGDPVERKQLAIHLVQYGIDLDAAMKGGLHFLADGGHRHGRKLVLALSALLLNDQAMAARVRDFQQGTFQEDGHLYVGAGSGIVLFGQLCTAADYWENQITGGNSRDCRDPYGYIDGGQEPGAYYQMCCTAKAFKATALALRLLPALRCIWTDDRILRYADRWVEHGAWTQPDPYQPGGNGALDNNPADGTGRWPGAHGAARDEGYYANAFADAMWAAYRSQASDTYSCSSRIEAPCNGVLIPTR
ncbi:hypothetical protein EER27_11930 [Lysobacter psychrotolerans]|uniref:Uncharacterized protein n=1 Tax=Montanilutibacter psychrotolerans TaxID=1327343 RepID=A0A3M8SUP9_9GAMM|nr:hypothetical protein EER27_11930 [Lysobacter psychrotolerans]